MATVVLGVLMYRAQFPKRRLMYWRRSVTPLLTAPAGVRGDVELRHKGRVLERPYAVDVILAGRGRRDVPSSAFDGGPLRLDVGAPIVEVLQVIDDPKCSTPTPRVRVDGSALLVGPDLIGRRQRIVFSLLVEDRPTLTCRSPLIDVPVGKGPPGLPRGPVGMVLFAIGGAAGTTPFFILGLEEPERSWLPSAVMLAGVTFALISFGFAFAANRVVNELEN
ncbi:hypothetical protein [Thermomonospora umbrina]|uniref:hypothetical protein n=1 Tax=Thermomonospora umbrina TaxID=111806 RepID=UPI0011C0DD89|nr:hypothetical protein [Thermomonospora umbrina]